MRDDDIARVTISLPRTLLRRARRAAVDRDETFSAYVRRAIERELAQRYDRPQEGR